MDRFKKILGFLLGTLGVAFLLSSTTYANNDYVCSYYSSACGNIAWESNWRADGTKHWIGTKITSTRIGNTRVGCPAVSTSSNPTNSVSVPYAEFSCYSPTNSTTPVYKAGTYNVSLETTRGRFGIGSQSQYVVNPLPSGITSQTSFDENGPFTIYMYGSNSCTMEVSNKTVTYDGIYKLYDAGFNGGFRWGDYDVKLSSCEVVMRDNVAPTAAADMSPNHTVKNYTGTIPGSKDCTLSNGAANPSYCTPVTTITDYTGTIPTGSGSKDCTLSNGAANPSYCTPVTTITDYTGTIPTSTDCNMVNGPLNPDHCTKVMEVASYSVTPKCTDNESWCTPPPAPFTVSKDASKDFTVTDRAGNTGTCTANGNGSLTGCSWTVLPANVYVPPKEKCTYTNGNDCTPDEVPPVGEISYDPAICTNQSVVVTNTCQYDLGNNGGPGSGCRTGTEKYGHTNPSPVLSNGWGTVGIADIAGNFSELPWSINWIDKSAPYNLNFQTTNQKAGTNNLFAISAIDDVIGAGCSNPDLSFQLNITGADTKTITGKMPRNGTPVTGYLGLTKSGNYAIHVTVTDQAGNMVTTDYSGTLIIYPADLDQSKSTVTLISANANALYANNSSTYQYKLTLKDAFENPIYNKSVSLINQEDDGTSGFKTVKTDMTDPLAPTGSDALSEAWNGVTNSNGEILFTVKSNTPGVFTERFKVTMNKWDDNFQDIAQTQSIYVQSGTNSFKKPFIGNLEVITVPNTLVLGTMLTTRLNVISKDVLESHAITQFQSQMRLADPTNQTFQNMSAAQDLTGNPTIDFRINSITDAGTSIVPSIYIDKNPIISYSIGGTTVQYRLSAGESGGDDTIISLGGQEINGLKVFGNLQGTGKQVLTNQDSNFTDISASSMRSVIKRNAYRIIAGMTNGQTVNGVKYVEGNYTLSGNPDYETLVVKNGNVTIAGNVNTSGKKFGIIVMRDNTSDTMNANIYVMPNVQYVNAIIYADGGLISSGYKSGEDTIAFYKDSPARSAALYRQLVLKGSLFTWNTIGGAVLGSSGQYTLPSGTTTTDFDIAMAYDLNYVRRSNSGWDKPSSSGGTSDYNEGSAEPFVIIYNSLVQTDPPKGFF